MLDRLYLSGSSMSMEAQRKAPRLRQASLPQVRVDAAAVKAIISKIDDARMDLVLLGDFYPSGDECEIVYPATGRLIAAAVISRQAGLRGIERGDALQGPLRVLNC